MAVANDPLRALAREVLARLLIADRHPTVRDLEDAAVIEQWRVVLPDKRRPYLLEGNVVGQFVSKTVVALNADVGWARTLDQWFVLGERAPSAQPVASPAEIRRAVAVWISGQPDDEGL
jgi:hypothetical protein